MKLHLPSRHLAAILLPSLCWLQIGCAPPSNAGVGEAAPTPPHKEKDPPRDSWPALLGSQRNGHSGEAVDPAPWREGAIPIAWQHPAGEGYAGASVEGGTVYFFDRWRDQNRLVALQAKTGKEIWRNEYPTHYDDLFDFSDGPRVAPVIDGDRIFTFGAEGRLRCLRAKDGSLLWEVDTARRYGVVQNFFGVGSTPWLEGDHLLVAIGGSPPGSPDIHSGKVQSAGSAVVAFHRETGEEIYRTGEELASYSSPLVVDHGGRRRAFYLARGGLLAFDPRSGKVDFHYPFRARRLYSVNAATPVVVGPKILLTESYELGARLLDISSGEPREVWIDPRRNQSLASHWSTPVHHQGILYGSHGEAMGSAELRAIELETGKVRWSQGGLGRTTQILAEGHLLVAGERGTIALIEATPESYREVGRLELGEVLGKDVWHPPAVAAGHLYLRGSRHLVAMRLRSTP